MTDIVIDLIDPTDTDLLAHLYNQIFKPVKKPEFFTMRFGGRRKPLAMVARVGSDAVGFYTGFELKPSTHFGWLCGVVPPYRRCGIATQLMRAAEDWVRTKGHHCMRFECYNRHRSMMHFAIASDYDIVGIRWDADRSDNLIIFERNFDDVPSSTGQ
ncbi:MAG: GNAT family N-acetyltransferase [Phycisphaerales bacterium]|nr:GNAT family N-acetyltransferase [Phycisphaerales bacterium]